MSVIELSYVINPFCFEKTFISVITWKVPESLFETVYVPSNKGLYCPMHPGQDPPSVEENKEMPQYFDQKKYGAKLRTG